MFQSKNTLLKHRHLNLKTLLDIFNLIWMNLERDGPEIFMTHTLISQPTHPILQTASILTVDFNFVERRCNKTFILLFKPT